jgi:hypothetical protein
VETFGLAEGKRMWGRSEVHHTPKHASWLNPAEIEVSIWSRQCLGRSRIGTLDELRRRTRQWNAESNRRKRKIIWCFETADARKVLCYNQSTMSRSRH